MKKLFLLLSVLFATAICSAQDVRFAFLTDCHYSNGSKNVDCLKECIADINENQNVDFVLFGGDLTDFGTDEEIAAVKEIFDQLKPEYYVVAGNHDAKWSESGCNTFLKVFGYEHFEFEKGGWRFLGCNCGPDMRMAPALLPKESMLWLEGLEGGKKSVFVNHYPQDTSVLNYFDVTRALKKAGVQWEIGGHWHSNTSLNYDGIPGALCRSTYNNGTGYSLVTLSDSKVVIRERRNVGGMWATFDPWYTQDLAPIVDSTVYDENGMPEAYPWMKYDINRKYTQVKEVWSFRDKSNIACGFAKSGNKAFYATTAGDVKAISLANGSKIWSRTLPGKVFSTPAISGGTLVVGCSDGNIYGLNASSGKIVWTVQAGKSVLGSAVIRKGIAYIGASDGHFRAIKASSGKVVWDCDGIDGFVESTPFVDETQVIIGTWHCKLYSIDTKTGKIQWVWQSPSQSRMISPAATVPVKTNGRVFIAVPDRKVYVLDAETGETLFRVNGGREATGLSADGQTLYVKTMYHHTFAFPTDASLELVGEDGFLSPSALKWNVENGLGYEISPTALVEAGDVVLVPSDKGNLIALDTKSGEYRWAHKLSIALINPMTVYSSGSYWFVLASTMDGKVEMLRFHK